MFLSPMPSTYDNDPLSEALKSVKKSPTKKKPKKVAKAEVVDNRDIYPSPLTGDGDIYASPEMTDESLGSFQMDDMDMYGHFDPIDEEQKDPLTMAMDQSRGPSSERNMGGSRLIADMVAAGLPVVSSLLSGASPTVNNIQFDRANKYAAIRGGQMVPSKANTLNLEDDQGNPYVELYDNSLGKKPYYQPGRSGGSSAGSNGAFGQPQRMYNPKTGERALVQQFKNGVLYRIGTNETIDDVRDWQQDLGVGTATGVDPYGTKTQDQYDKNKVAKQTRVKTTPGYGTLTKTPINTAKGVDKIIDTYEKDTTILNTKLNELNNATAVFKKRGASPTELTSAREALIRAVTTESRLTDEDVERALGNDYRDILSQVGGVLTNKTFGELSVAQRQDFLKGIDMLGKRLQGAIEFAKNKAKTRSSGLPQGKGYFESQIPNSKEDTNWKKSLKGIR